MEDLLCRTITLHEDTPEAIGEIYSGWGGGGLEREGDEAAECGVQVFLEVVVRTRLDLPPSLRFLLPLSSIISGTFGLFGQPFAFLATLSLLRLSIQVQIGYLEVLVGCRERRWFRMMVFMRRMWVLVWIGIVEEVNGADGVFWGLGLPEIEGVIHWLFKIMKWFNLMGLKSLYTLCLIKSRVMLQHSFDLQPTIQPSPIALLFRI